MPRIVEVVPGERVALETERYDVDFDRRKGRLRLVERPLLGRPRQREIPLIGISGLRLDWSDETARPTLATVKKILQDERSSETRPADETPESLIRSAKDLELRVQEETASGTRETVIAIPLQDVDSEEKLVELAMNLAAAADLLYLGLFKIPQGELEIRARREPGTGFADLARSEIESGGDALAKAVRRAMATTSVPPFEPDSLSADVEVIEWQPGRRVVFRRRLSFKAFVAFPFVFLVLAGPALALSRLAAGRPPGWFTIAIVTVIGLGFGGACLGLFLRQLPRTVVFCWSESTLTLRSLFRRRLLPFAEIRRLLLSARSESGGSQAEGSSSVQYYGELDVVSKADGGNLRLLETARFSRSDGPLRQVIPLGRELAEALGVELRVGGEASVRK